MAPTDLPARLGRLADKLLLALLVAVAFALGCYEMGDSDVWWHLRGGEWILEHGRVPGLDPFTFGSEDRAWVDIHWSYQVVLALAYRVGGAGALVVLGAAMGGLAFLVTLTARRREWPAAAVVLCWAPALVLVAFRLDPRPEVFSLFYLGCFLAVLWRAQDRPAWAWAFVPVQVLWANAQGLFILGPVLVLLFAAGRAVELAARRLKGASAWGADEKHWWRHVGGAALAVAAASLVNPYGLDGARFPLDLFPKVAEEGNVYKQYVDELMSPRDFVRESTAAVAGRNWFFLAFYGLLLLLPLSFLLPALRRALGGQRPGAWYAGLWAVVALLAAELLTIPGKGVPAWLRLAGDNTPLLALLAGVGLALGLRHLRLAGLLALASGTTISLWLLWLRGAVLGEGRGLLGPGLPPALLGVLLAASGITAAVLVVWHGGSVFRILLAGAFAYLALQALQNWGRFGLVAGAVLMWNFGEWAAELASSPEAGRRRVVAGWGLRLGLAAGLAVWLVALLGDRYYVHTGEPRHLAFREQPLEFAHDAAVFAGQDGLPDRALVYGLGQTGVYVFHNAPGRKPFMDGRLEMPGRRTFDTYVLVENALRQNDPRWEPAVAAMGKPLLLLEHANNHAAEARLLTHPGWRCVYYDALASVFVPRGAGASEADFPTVEFAARHFRAPPAPPTPDVPGAAARELKALFNLAASLPRTPDVMRRWRVPVLLHALDRAGRALDEEPARPEGWVLLGNCHWDLSPALQTRPPTPAEGWAAEAALYWAQATYCHRRALECQPDHVPAWRYLYQSYGARGMADAQLAAGEEVLRLDPRATGPLHEQVRALRQTVGSRPLYPVSADQLASALARLLAEGRPAAAARALDQSAAAGWPWPLAEQAAGLYMHLGRPADARRVWRQASDCPSPALRQCRLAYTYWVERDFGAARECLRQARAADPRLGEACWASALFHAQLGEADTTLEACRAGLQRSLNERQRADLEALRALVQPLR